MAPSSRTALHNSAGDGAQPQAAENAAGVLAASRAAATAYHSAFDAFRRSTTSIEFEAAMETLEAAQVAEQEARRADMGRVTAITARCEYTLTQNPGPDAWWAIVGLGVEMEGATTELIGDFEEERVVRCHDLFHAAEAKVQEGLLNRDPWECPPIIARIFDNSGGETSDLCRY